MCRWNNLVIGFMVKLNSAARLDRTSESFILVRCPRPPGVIRMKDHTRIAMWLAGFLTCGIEISASLLAKIGSSIVWCWGQRRYHDDGKFTTILGSGKVDSSVGTWYSLNEMGGFRWRAAGGQPATARPSARHPLHRRRS